jgi:hypothetical protein
MLVPALFLPSFLLVRRHNVNLLLFLMNMDVELSVL